MLRGRMAEQQIGRKGLVTVFHLSENILEWVFLASLNLWTKILTYMWINEIKV